MTNPLDCMPQNEWDAFIYSIVEPFYPLCTKDAVLSPDDLQQEAWIGLLAACKRYNPAKFKNKFQTFAYCYIRGHILRFIANRTINKPVQVSEEDVNIDILSYLNDTPEREDLMNVIYDKIPDQAQQILLIEHFVHGKSLRQISREMGLSHEAVVKRMHKILDLLEVRLNHANR